MWRSKDRAAQWRADLCALVARLGLGAAFLSAVADRLGFWGAAGEPGVVWGNFANFEAYTATLNPWAPASLVPALAWLATVLELAASIALGLGLGTRAAAALSAALLAAFALAMTLTVGPKAPLDYSVWTAMGTALLVGLHGPGRWSLDAHFEATQE